MWLPIDPCNNHYTNETLATMERQYDVDKHKCVIWGRNSDILLSFIIYDLGLTLSFCVGASDFTVTATPSANASPDASPDPDSATEFAAKAATTDPEVQNFINPCIFNLLCVYVLLCSQFTLANNLLRISCEETI